jgi:P pilus assembly chaperone PapD
MAGEVLPTGYGELSENLKSRIRTARVQAALSVNRELVLLYWHIGKEIPQKQQQEGWAPRSLNAWPMTCVASFPI